MMSLSHYSKTVLFAPFFASFQGAFLLLSSSLFSLPSGGEVIRGQASLVSSSDMLQVYAEGKSILHWEEFHIGSKESVHFIQSQPKEAILNRIVSGSASQILGTLKANCPIYLINPQGVYLGSSAYVETAGFLASTADLSNDDFWQGLAMQFKSFEEGSIVNLGAIYTLEGDAILLARAVDNQGSIQAPEGNVILATHEMMLYPETKKSVLIRIEEEILKEESIENSGTIEALAVELKTCSPYEKAIRHTGSIQAFSTAEQNGRIYLIAEEGGTVLNGFLLAEGGEIQVLGQTVLLEAGAVLDVSGGQGGTILIGGDYQGKNSEVKNAQFTQVEPEVHILADAWENGDGGKVIVWSDQATSYAGTISARGGAYSGDGGFVEVSGKRLQFEGKVNTDAPYGKIGTLLLDPTNITISTGADSGGSFSGCMAGTNTFTPDAAVTDTINTTTLNGLLNAPCNVTISTVGSAGGGTGAITISNDIGAAGAWSAATTLTLTAASFITVSASITNTSATTGFTALSMTANGTGATTNPGILLSAGTITTTGGDVILNGTSSTATTASHGLSISGGAIVTTAGNISVTGTVPTGATGASVFGINMNTANGVTSSTGNMAISGTSASSGAGSHGVQIAQSWTTGTSGDVIFSSCVGGTGGSNGINVGAAFSTAGNIIATSSIQGRGNAGVGFASGVNFSTTGSSKTIAITASATGTTGASHGISLTAGTLSTTGGGSITLTGTGGASNTASHGINISGTGLVSTTTGNGSIALTGTASGAAAGVGINIAGSTNSITSGSGTITLGGTSAATIAASHGVSINTNGWSPGTSALVSFSTCTGGNTGASHGVNFSSAFTGNGDVTFTSCQGGTGGGNGINVAAAFTTPGTITAISTITGRGNAGVGFASSANFAATGAGHSIAITATATGTTGACHGISITAGTLSTNAGDSITLTGTGGASNTASHGINISGTGLVSTTTGNGSIALTGTASGAAAGVGINIASSSSSITSGSGTITLGGTSTATGAASHGVSVNTSGWTPGTSALVSFSTCTGGSGGSSHGVNFSSAFTGSGDVTFTSCTGGTGGSGHGVNFSGAFIGNGAVTFSSCLGGITSGNGINVAAAFAATGTITATSSITGRGADGVGFASSANFATTGAGHNIAITATATGTTGACRGILITAGTVSTNADGSITLNGTGGSSGSNCQGILMTSGGISAADGAISLTGNGGASSSGIHITAGTISTTGTTMGVGNITLLGTAGGNLGGYGVVLSGSTSVVQTVNGLISVTGNGAGTGINAEGIGVFSAAKIQSMGTGNVTLIGTASSTGGNSSRGVVVNGGSSVVSTISGTLSVTGTGGNGGISNSGIEVSTGGKLSTTSGSLTGTGTGGAGLSGCTGIFVTGSGSLITVSTGTGINLTGVGNGTTTSNQGISLTSGGGITTTGNAPITLIATGSISGISSNEGIFMTGASTAISTVTGAIQITATAGGGTTNGLTVDTSATVLSSQAGLVTVNSVNNNVAVQNNSSIKTQGTGGPGINNIAINSQGLSVAAGASGSAVISTVNGNIAIPSTGAVSVAGSSATNGFGQITVGNAANTVTIQMTSLTLTGSSGSGSFAEISTSGGLLSIDGGGLLSLTGGSNTNTAAQILLKTTTLTTATTAIQIGAVTPPSGVTLSYGMIASNEGGNILCTTTGNYAITGGTSNVDSRAGFYTGVNTGSGNLQLTGSGFSLTGGASGSGYNSAEILAAAGGGAITITSDGSPLTLFAGGAATSDARIASLGSGSVGISNISSLALTGGSGSLLSRALIGTGQGGNITVTGSGNYSIAAGSSSSDGRAGFYTGITSGSGDINLTGAGFYLTGGVLGSGYNSAEILAAAGGGAITITSNGSQVLLLAKEAAISDARIVSLGLGNIIISNIGRFTAMGSLGTTLSRAMVATSQGGDITVTGSSDYTITAGASAGDGRAGFYTGLAAGSGDIDLTGSGFYLTGGLFGVGYNSAEIMTSPTGGGSITLTSGANPIHLQGGGALTSSARILAAGSGDITITGTGTLSAIGGNGATSIAEVNAPGDLTIDLDTGSYFLTGGRGPFSVARCTAAGDLDLTGTNYILTAGSSSVIDGANAVIASTGINGSVTLLAQNGGAVALSGGTLADQHSYIQTTGATGSNPLSLTCGSLTINGRLGSKVDHASAEVRTVSGDIGITVSGAVLLNGGIGSDANGLIQSTSQGAITIDALSLNIQILENSEGGRSGIITQSGDILITCSQDARCAAWTSGSVAAIQTFGSDLTLTAGGSINLLGFSTLSTPTPTGNLLLIAGQNIFIDNHTQVAANGIINSSLTLVVDNDFPASIGPGQFTLNPTGSISAGLGTPVRIYTARRSQNIVVTGTDINGTAYTPGPFGVDTPTEQWGIFYPGGVYTGAAFNIYYKES